MPNPVFITRLTLRNYKSIAACQLKLGSLTFLVGPNGSGKSNCLDSLRLVSESLRTSLDHALRDRGTIREVRRRSGGHPNHFAIRLDFNIPNNGIGHYTFQVGAKESGRFEVQTEECVVTNGLREHFYLVERGHVVNSSLSLTPAAFSDRLYLVAASGLPEFRPLYDALSGMEIYNLNPKEIGAMQKPDAGELLRRDGSNAASVFHKLPAKAKQRVNDYLARIVRGVADAETQILGSQETVEFRQAIKGQKHPWRFLAASMSDGTLRAFGILVALFQITGGRPNPPPLIGLEEPEMALHPAASHILLAALREAATATQVMVTSHSPDLLDDSNIPTEAILAVDNEEGITKIGPIDKAGRSVLKDKLFTPGELLRQNQLAPDREMIAAVEDDRQLNLFEVNGR
jgi:predicted ATPase